MRSGVPWSVKGIEPEAREAAKQAARRAGVTLGAWLNQIIMDTGTDEVGQSDNAMTLRPAAAAPHAAISHTHNQAAPVPPQLSSQPDLGSLAQAMREIAERVERSERRNSELARKLEQSVGHLAERLDESEHAMSEQRTLDPLERKIQQLAERLDEAERGRGSLTRRPDDKAAIQTLEKAVNAVVDHLDTAERRTEDSLQDIRKTLAQLSSRMEEAEEQTKREESDARQQALQNHLGTLAGRLEKMEQSVAGVGTQAVEAALKAINDKADAENHKATIAQLQRGMIEITQRLERAENRTGETLKTFEMTVTSIARRLEELDAPRPSATPDMLRTIESRIEQMAERLNRNEELTLQAAQTVERAIAGMSDSLNTSEGRARETVESLHVMLERMTDRLARLEKETKAARTQPMLPPQITSGHIPMPRLEPGSSGGIGGGIAPSMGNGFAPPGQAFPAPDFDMPPMGALKPSVPASAAGGAAPFAPSAPFADSPYSGPPPSAATSIARETDDEEIAPPPFAPEAKAGEDAAEMRMPGEAQDEPQSGPADDARAAHDFLAAARRAAQAAAQGNRHTPQPLLGSGQAPFADTSARFMAVDAEGERRRRKLLTGAAAALLALAAALGAYRFLNVAPATQPAPQPAAADGTLQPEGAKPQAETKTPVTPETGAQNSGAAPIVPAAAPSTSAPSTSAPITAVPSADIPAAPQKSAASEPARPQVPAARIPRPETAAPALTPAPAKPVATAPIGEAAPRDPVRAAAANGNAAAQYEIGQRYANGEGAAQDLAQAYYWYRQAANQGLAVAQYRLATLYEKGRGIGQDDAQARLWYEKAAMQGNVKAMHNLAVIHAEGRGTRQDFTTAARWFGEAAERGLGDSQYNLAILQERGLGVQQDLVSAYKWLAIAARGGDQGAAQKRDELAQKLDPASLAQAKVAAETWRAKTPDPLANGGPDVTGSLASPAGQAGLAHDPARTEIARAQALLMRLGYDPGTSDGRMGTRTRDAIRAYQRSAGLEETGNVDAALLKSLDALVN